MSVTEELVALLQKGDIEGFNEKRRNRGRIEMFAVDLSGLTLTGADLSGIVMEKADLSGADLTDTILARTDLTGADLSETRLTGAMAIQLRLRDAWIGIEAVRTAHTVWSMKPVTRSVGSIRRVLDAKCRVDITTKR